MLDTNTIKNVYASEVKVGQVTYQSLNADPETIVQIDKRTIGETKYYDITFDSGEQRTYRQDRYIIVSQGRRKFTQHDVRQARQLLELTQGDVAAAKRMALGGHADEDRKRLAAAVEAVAPKDAPDDAPEMHREDYA
jgi:hypothetical protein